VLVHPVFRLLSLVCILSFLLLPLSLPTWLRSFSSLVNCRTTVSMVLLSTSDDLSSPRSINPLIASKMASSAPSTSSSWVRTGVERGQGREGGRVGENDG